MGRSIINMVKNRTKERPIPASLSKNSHRRHAYATRKFAKRTCSAVTCQGIGIVARLTGFSKRASTFNVAAFYRSVIGAVGEGRKFSIADIQRRCACLSGGDIRCKPLHSRICQDECVDFFTCMAAKQVDRALRVSPFPDGRQFLSMHGASGINVAGVRCQDGTCWPLKKELSGLFPESRSSSKAEAVPVTFGEDGKPVLDKPKCAQIGIQFRASVVSRCIVDAPVTSARANEKERLGAIDLKGSHFIVKGRSNTAGSIVSCTVRGSPQGGSSGCRQAPQGRAGHRRQARRLPRGPALLGRR